MLVFFLRRKRPLGSAPRIHKDAEKSPQVGCRIAPKPPWVREEVIRLKALMPGHGCRKDQSLEPDYLLKALMPGHGCRKDRRRVPLHLRPSRDDRW